MMLKRFVAPIGFALALLIQAHAQLPGNPENWCRQGFFTRDTPNFGIGFIKGRKGSRAYFYDDTSEKCPKAQTCRSAAYVVPGDKVITTRKYDGFVCAWFAPIKGAPTVGWLRETDVDFPELLSDASVKAWIGEWQYADNSITIARDKDPSFVKIAGNAFWKGLGDNIHIGELDGRYAPRDGVIEYADGNGEFDCKARIQLESGFLVVSDNMNCGGVNVTFSGVYRKISNSPASNKKK